MIESHVTNLELSKKLKEIGLKQESSFYHVNAKFIGEQELENEVWFIAHVSQLEGKSKNWYSAFLASELLELLPRSIHGKQCDYFLTINKTTDGFLIDYQGYWDKILISKLNANICNALSEIFIHIIENKLIEVPQ